MIWLVIVGAVLLIGMVVALVLLSQSGDSNRRAAHRYSSRGGVDSSAAFVWCDMGGSSSSDCGSSDGGGDCGGGE
jgi:hypothetical protein